MRIYKLDKIIDSGTVYEMESKRGYIIEKVATDSTTRAVIRVEDAPVGEIVADLANLYPTLRNLNPPLDLKELRIVVKPKEKLRFDGSSGSKMRIIGKIFELETGEAVPGELDLRSKEQLKKYITYLTGSVTVAAGQTVAAGTETTLIDFEVGAGRKYVLNREYQAEGRLDNLTNVPNFWSRIYLNGAALDVLATSAGKFGIPGQSAPNPPRHVTTTTTDIEAQTVEKVAASLADMPITLVPGDRLKITMINNGGDYTVPTGRTLYQICHVVAVYEKVGE